MIQKTVDLLIEAAKMLEFDDVRDVGYARYPDGISRLTIAFGSISEIAACAAQATVIIIMNPSLVYDETDLVNDLRNVLVKELNHEIFLY